MEGEWTLVGMMMRKLLATTICARRFPPPYSVLAASDRKSFASAPSKKPPPASKPPKPSEAQIPDPQPIVPAPTLTEAADPQKSSSVGVIVGLALVAAAGGLTWLTLEGKLPLKLNLPQNPWKQTIPEVGKDVSAKGPQEVSRGGDRNVLESQQDRSKATKDSFNSDNEQQLLEDHEDKEDVKRESKLVQDEPKDVSETGLDTILKLLEEEGNNSAHEGHTVRDVEDESCPPDSTTPQESSEVTIMTFLECYRDLNSAAWVMQYCSDAHFFSRVLCTGCSYSECQ